MARHVADRSIETPSDAPSGDAVYARLLTDEVLAYQRCAACESAVFPPRTRCPRCGADELGWHASDGVGTVYSTTVITPRGAEPYAVVLVDLDAGHRMMSRITGALAQEVMIGARVEVRFERQDDDVVLPLFVPVEDGAR